MKATIGLKYLAALCHEGDLESYLTVGDSLHLFNAAEKPVADYIAEHVGKFGTIPKVETVAIHTDGELDEKPPEPSSYYLEHLRQRYLDKGLRAAVEQSSKLLKGDNKDPRAAVETMFSQCVDLMTTEKAANLFDFRDALEPVMAEHTAKQMGEDIGIELGWPTLDGMMGGARKGDLISYVGRPQKGKTFQMLYSALHGWENQHKRVMFCTFEMAGPMIRQRLASMYAHVPGMGLKLGSLTTGDKIQVTEALTTAKDMTEPLWIVDAGMASTVPDLMAVARSLQPDVIYLDGAYLIQHENTRLDRFRRIDAVAEQIKHILCPLAPSISSWQLNKKAAQKKKDDPVTGDDVYGSDTILQLSEVMLGIFQPDTPENIHTKLIDILKVAFLLFTLELPPAIRYSFGRKLCVL